MPLTKQYLRYVPAGSLNIIASPECNIAFVILQCQEGRFVAVGACENIIIWDLRLGEKSLVLAGEKHEVSRLSASPDKTHLAAGYTDGSVRIFDLTTGEAMTVFSGHRKAISCLAYDCQGHFLASGSKDTDIVVWDVMSEAGLKRLNGHKGIVTQVQFMAAGRDVLVSCSKDSYIKCWDLQTGHCFKTIAGHVTEVWGMVVVRDDDFLVAGSGDSELRVWQVGESGALTEEETKGFLAEDGAADVPSPIVCVKAGSILRTGRKRVTSLATDPSGQLVGVHGPENILELFRFVTPQEAKARSRKRLNKMRKRAAKLGEDQGDDKVESGDSTVPSLKDAVLRMVTIKASGKLKSHALVMGKGELRVACLLSNNTVELYSVVVAERSNEPTLLRQIAAHGHHSEVRALAFSSDNLAIASASADSIKMWNRPSLSCLRTVKSGYALCICFVPGDRHLLVGLSDGRLVIVDIAAGDVLEEIAAHAPSELWSVTMLPDQTGVASGGGDSTVKLWQLELVPDSVGGTKAKVLSLLHTRTLKLDGTVLAVRVTLDSQLLAVALLNSTVKLFFLDSFKFFLSLYGHKLPVLCLDISSDSALIATGSADRTVKVWHRHHGDCRMSKLAHDLAVTAVAFAPRTHYLFSCGKDGRIKQWDCDSKQRILSLQGHFGEAWSLAVSASGQFVVSSGLDRVIRMYERTDEILVLQDQQEEERAEEEDNTLATGVDTTAPGNPNLNLPTRKTVSAEKGAELLLECLEVGCEFREEYESLIVAGRKPPPPLPIMMAFNATTPDEYLIAVIKKIRPSEMEEVMLLLPLSSACRLLALLPGLMKDGTANAEFVGRIAMFLLRVHHGPITANTGLLPVIKQLQDVMFRRVNHIRDLVGENLHGLMYLQREMEVKEGVHMFLDATVTRKDREKRKRRKEKTRQAAVMAL